MKKNGLLTFIFACIPGAGQMYYGYMQRGLSIAMILILCVMAATVVEPLLFLCLVIWMYSFFDTYDLIRHMAAGEPKEDSLLVLGNYEEIKKMVPQHNRLIGWGLVGFGVWALYDIHLNLALYAAVQSCWRWLRLRHHHRHTECCHCGTADFRGPQAAGSAPRKEKPRRRASAVSA